MEPSSRVGLDDLEVTDRMIALGSDHSVFGWKRMRPLSTQNC